MGKIFIERDITPTIKEAMRYFPVITITGPRQSGKTTLIRNAFPDIPYYSLEDIQIREFAHKDPIAFLGQHPSGKHHQFLVIIVTSLVCDTSFTSIFRQYADGITGIEIKSSMTYHNEFEKSLRQLQKWTTRPIKSRAVVYAGEYENRQAEIQLINFRHTDCLF